MKLIKCILSMMVFLSFQVLIADCPSLDKVHQLPDGHWEAQSNWVGEERNHAYANAIPKKSPILISFYSASIEPSEVTCAYLTNQKERVFISFRLNCNLNAKPIDMKQWFSVKNDGKHWACMPRFKTKDTSICSFIIE